MRIDQALAALSKLKPRSRAALPVRLAGEKALMKILKEGGIREIERRVAALNERGHRFTLIEKGAGYRGWREELAGGRRLFELRVAVSRAYRFWSAALRYLPVKKLTRAQRELHAVQKRFYDRYMAIGQKAYRDPSYRLSAVERRLLLVGELEADVNNGGFSQYLLNKGRRRARGAVSALVAIGARKTASMLEQALAPGVSDRKLAALDDRFYKVPEDLAVLAARHACL